MLARGVEIIFWDLANAIDALLEGKGPEEQIETLRQKVLETTSSLDEATRQKEAQEESQQERNLLFISEIEKMQKFAMEGMASVSALMRTAGRLLIIHVRSCHIPYPGTKAKGNPFF